jgi:DNA mismatch endonuclease (patch repair protein)
VSSQSHHRKTANWLAIASANELDLAASRSRVVSKQMDVVNKTRRSAMMARIRGKNTKPELRVRQVVHALGFRYRLHCRALPGSPDLVFPRLKKVILVHGCFWHRHEGCRYAYSPKSNIAFWQEKFQKNRERDLKALSNLVKQGWDPLVIWECQARDPQKLQARIIEHLEKSHLNGH